MVGFCREGWKPGVHGAFLCSEISVRFEFAPCTDIFSLFVSHIYAILMRHNMNTDEISIHSVGKWDKDWKNICTTSKLKPDTYFGTEEVIKLPRIRRLYLRVVSMGKWKLKKKRISAAGAENVENTKTRNKNQLIIFFFRWSEKILSPK